MPVFAGLTPNSGFEKEQDEGLPKPDDKQCNPLARFSTPVLLVTVSKVLPQFTSMCLDVLMCTGARRL